MKDDIKMPVIKWFKVNNIPVCEYFQCPHKPVDCGKCALHTDQNFLKWHQQNEETKN